MPLDRADEIIQSLVDHAPMKVWSYLATVFGDLASAPGEEIGGVVLSALTERAGIRPEAMRVALHRLRKDDWIVARREGRNSLYRLSERGLAETVKAGERIYAREIERPETWHMLVANPASNGLPDRDGYLRISADMVLGAGACGAVSPDVLAVEITRMAAPAWLLHDADGEENYGRVAAALIETGAALDRAGSLSILDRTTIRLLAIHHWRRAVLRRSPLIEMLHGKDWIGATCRGASSDLLDRLPRPTLDALHRAVRAAG